MVKTLVDSIDVHAGGVVDQVVQLSASDLCDLLCCALAGSCRQRYPVKSKSKGVVDYLKRAIVGYITCDYVDILEVGGNSLEVCGSLWVTNDGKDNGVGPTGLRGKE